MGRGAAETLFARGGLQKQVLQGGGSRNSFCKGEGGLQKQFLHEGVAETISAEAGGLQKPFLQGWVAETSSARGGAA